MISGGSGTRPEDSAKQGVNPWKLYCRELAAWAWDRLAIKRDRHGVYSANGGAAWSKGAGAELSVEKLAAHFAGESTLGLGVTSSDDRCLWVAWDLDNHVTDEATNQNLAYAVVLMNRLAEVGFQPIVEDSDGKGGVHVWVLFLDPIPAAMAFEFARLLARDFADYGLEKIECFPKSPTVQHTSAKCGNYVRIPGKHHKREHWSRVWGDGEWLDAAGSVQLLLSQRGVAAELVAKAIPIAKLESVLDGLEFDGASDRVAKSAAVNVPSSSGLRSDGNVIERARKYLGRIPGAVSGSSGHDATYHAACVLVKGFELSADQAFELLAEWNEVCQPPWTEAELQHKIQSALRASGESGYLIQARPEQWGSVRVPEYRQGAADRTPAEDARPVGRSLLRRSVWNAITSPAPMHEVVVDGLVRRGEVMNIIASTKVGKSWLAAGMAFCIATGREWFGRRVLKGNVLLIDNELHDETIQNRMAAVAEAMNLRPNETYSGFDYVALRGELIDIIELETLLNEYGAGELALVILDAKYRFFGDLEENSNEHQTIFHNIVDRLAKQLNAVIALIHHSTKGDQNGKSVTDVGSGGGAQSRAADCHLVIRPHSDEGLAVLDGAVRTFKPVSPQTLRWQFPLWSIAEGVDPVLKTEKTRGESKRAEDDRRDLSRMADIFHQAGPDAELSRYEIQQRFGGGKDRCNRLIRLGQDEKRFVLTGTRPAKNGSETDLFKLGCWASGPDSNGDDDADESGLF